MSTNMTTKPKIGYFSKEKRHSIKIFTAIRNKSFEKLEKALKDAAPEIVNMTEKGGFTPLHRSAGIKGKENFEIAHTMSMMLLKKRG